MKNELTRSLHVLAEHRNMLRKKYRVKDIGIFGSVAGGTSRSDSDVDVLVSFTEPVSLFTFLDLEQEVATLLGRKADLVSKSALKPALRRRILESVAYA